MRAAPAIEGRMGQVGQVGLVGRVGLVRRVGRVRQVGRVGQVGQVGVRAAPAIVGQVRRVGVVCFSVLGAVIRCLYFANCSPILRSSCILPISNVKGRCREKKFLFSDNLMIISFFS